MTFGARKFYKLNGLTGAFKMLTENPPIFKTTIVNDPTGCFTDDFAERYSGLIDEHTILFITACQEDEGKFVKIVSKNLDENDEYTDGKTVLFELSEGDTLIWARGDVYCVSSKSVKEIKFDEDTKEFVFLYTDGTEERIAQSEGQEYTGKYPIFVDDLTKEIKLVGISFDELTKSLTIDTDINRVGDGVENAIVMGKGNVALTPYQHIEGTYANPNSQSAFVIGNGIDQNNRSNLFVITFNGVSHINTDFTAGGTINTPLYKLSDIHSVLNEDWAFIGYNSPSYNNSYSNDYDAAQ